MHNIIIKNDVDLRSATKLHGVLVSCTEQNTKIRVPVQPGVYGIQHGAECVHDVVQTAKNYSAMRLHYSVLVNCTVGLLPPSLFGDTHG